MPIYWKSIGPSRFKFRSLLKFSLSYVYDEKNDSTKMTENYHRNTRDLVEWFFISPTLILIGGLAIAAGNVHNYLTDGILTTPLEFEMPFLQKESISSFYINLIGQIVYAGSGLYGLAAIEMCQSIVNNTIKLFVAVISTNIEELNTRLMNKRKMDLELKTHFRNILVQIQDYDR